MKRINWSITILLLLFVGVACTHNKGEEPDIDICEECDVVFCTMNDFINFLEEGTSNYTNKITERSNHTGQSQATTEANVKILTLNGYTYMTSEGNKKGVFSKEVASRIGIQPGVYIVAREHYSMEFDLDEAQYILMGYPVDHSRCGYMPTSQKPTRGYAVEQEGKHVTLTTLIVHIKSDMYGFNIGLYSPLGYDINKLQWSLPIITTN